MGGCMNPIVVIILWVVGVMMVAPVVAVGLYYAHGLLQRRKKRPKLLQGTNGEANLAMARALVEKTIRRQAKASERFAKWEAEISLKEAKREPQDPQPPVLRIAMERYFDKFERQIEERERLAKEPPASVLSPETEARIDAFVESIKLNLERVALIMQHAKRLFNVADRNIDRAYVHLCRQVSEAHEAGAISEVCHADMETHIRLAPAEIADDESIAELIDATAQLRRKNFFVGEALFRVDRVVRRLQVVRLLLRGLPNSAREEIAQFCNALHAVSEYVEKVCTTTDEPSTNDLYSRIEHLEQRTLMVYIRLAKNRKLRESARERLVRAIREISDQLERESINEKELHCEWSERGLAAEIGGTKLIAAVSELRTEQCETVLASLERTSKVLDGVASALTVPAERRQSS